jgi:protein involved in polysaccharide export with SLBB domain
MHRSRVPAALALVLLVLGFASCTTTPDKRLLQYLNQEGFGNRYSGNADEENWLAISDTLTIEDPNNESLNNVVRRVGIDGTVLLPDLGAVAVAGMTRSEVEALLMEKYSPYYPILDIKVDIVTNGKKYFVFGEVAAEGERPFEGDLTLFEAVIRAAPKAETANLGRVKLIRARPTDGYAFVVDLTEIITHHDSTFNIHVQERDIIFVPPTMLAQLGYFLDSMLFPVKQVLGGLGNAFFAIDRLSGNGYYGGGNNGGIF